MKRFLAILLSALMVFSTMSVMATEVEDETMAVSYAGNGVFNIAASVGGEGYKVVVAQYDAGGTMIDVVTEDIVDNGATVELSGAFANTKFMLWNMNDATPCAEVVALPDEGGYNLITAKTEVGTSTGGDVTINPLSNLVDGDDSTLAAFYGGAGRQGAMYVDLEKGYEIDRIDVLAYHNFFNRGSGFDVVLGNEVPDNIAFAEGAGEFKAGHVDEDLAATSTSVGYKTFYVPANAGSYRYVSFETFDETDGLAVAEVKVYVKRLGEQVEYMSVTDKATTHKSSETATAANYETDGNNAFVDGNPSTSYGTGPETGAYYSFVDLGAGGRRVDKIVITANDAYGPNRVKGQKYYLANTLPVNGTDRSEWVYLGTRINTTSSMTFVLDETQAGVYRYVVADCTDSAVGGIISEIEVYKDSTVKEVEYVSVTENATSHKSRATATAANYETDPGNRLVDGDYSTLYGAGPAANGYFTFIDLGEGGRRVDMVVITANDPHNRVKGQKYYLANTLPVNGADRSEWVYLGERTANGFSMAFVLTEEQAGMYRYVVADCTASTVGDYVNEIEVYKNADVKEILNVTRGKTVTASHAGYDIYNNPAKVTDGVFKDADGNNQFIITKAPSTVCIDLEATYSIEKLVLDAVLKNETYNFTVNLDVYISDTPAFGDFIHSNATKVLHGSAEGWDSSVKTIELDKPVVGRYVIIQKTALGADNDSFRLSEVEALGTLADGATYDYELVESSAEVTSYYAQLQNTGWAVNYVGPNSVSSTMFTDNNSSTRYGRGNGGDVAWIDLGEAKMIDAVKVQLNDEYMAVPSSPMVFYVTNEDPAVGLRANTNADGYLTVPETWVSINGNGHIWRTQNISETTYGPAVPGKYRYVIVTDPTVDYNLGNADGNGLRAYVSEITPYALVEK